MRQDRTEMGEQPIFVERIHPFLSSACDEGRVTFRHWFLPPEFQNLTKHSLPTEASKTVSTERMRESWSRNRCSLAVPTTFPPQPIKFPNGLTERLIAGTPAGAKSSPSACPANSREQIDE